ncbi:hypothetical protein HPP92_013306 [Vanilla planifolia]|uniref:Transmembrane protein n=1 Tax=Vanilla planifolia TaxID=51239 RepID=A0A835QN63_VANPL|nr:hypothetical protein HPP92_013306 [Vanilla planifolia]
MLTCSTLESILSASASRQLLSACRRNLSLAPIHHTPRALFSAASLSASASAFFPLSRSRRRRGNIKNESWWAPRAKVVLPQASEADAFPTERCALVSLVAALSISLRLVYLLWIAVFCFVSVPFVISFV